LSSASLHAIGPVLGSTMAGKKLGRGMSFWMVGGELGRSLGPLIVVTAVGYLTMQGLPWLMLAGIFTSVFLFIKLNSITTQARSSSDHPMGKVDLGKMRGVIIPLAVLIISRSMMVAVLSTFLPTFLTGEGSSLWIAGASLSILQGAGVVGAFFSGSLSDRFGRRKLLAISYIMTPILMFLFMQVKGWLNLPLLVLLGFFAFAVIPVIMAIVMENYPANRSFANGIYMAFNFIVNSLAVVLAGRLGDLVNLRFTFLLSAGLILIGIPFIFFLPRSQKSLAL
jgi:FSR family fosmidomycin resistance protein-like MFS transporter